MHRLRSLGALVAIAIAAAPSIAHAETYRVGPGETYRELAELPALTAGDVVLVIGGATYESFVFGFDWDGTEAMPITIRGVPDASGARPVISGGTNTLEFQGDHYVVESLDITGGSFRCVFHHADAITIRDTVVHDCPQHGILGADSDSGSLTLERVEVHHTGAGDRNHQIYMATDEEAHPGSVFRMEHCWIHDANGGNGVKSRAERNEIYYNWIEGSYYHELELIGPDGADEALAREDSDVVGNVLVKSGANEAFAVVRFGGDGTGQTHGRYRFVANTVVVANGSGAAVFRLFDGLESVEMHDNVFVARGGGAINLLREAEAEWVTGARIVGGSHNWVPTGSSNVPPEWTDTIVGDDPGLTDVDALDLRPASVTSAVVDQGVAAPTTLAVAPFPTPLPTPLSSPLHGPGGVVRPTIGALDLGAYEFGTAPIDVDGGTLPAIDGGGLPFDGGGIALDGGGIALDGGGLALDGGGASTESSGCGCRVASRGPSGASLAWIALGLAIVIWRRRR